MSFEVKISFFSCSIKSCLHFLYDAFHTNDDKKIIYCFTYFICLDASTESIVLPEPFYALLSCRLYMSFLDISWSLTIKWVLWIKDLWSKSCFFLFEINSSCARKCISHMKYKSNLDLLKKKFLVKIITCCVVIKHYGLFVS